MLILYQAEWCPHSHRVRQRLTELGVDYVAKQIPARREDRAVLRRATGTDRVPVLIADGGAAIEGSTEILRYLEARFEEPADARFHRLKAREHDPRYAEVGDGELQHADRRQRASRTPDLLGAR